MKKTLAILLTLALVICMMPASAFADGPGSNTIDVAGVTVSVKNSTVTYNGQTQKPELQFSSKGDQLTENVHYTITWTKEGTSTSESEVKNVGTYKGQFMWKTETTAEGSNPEALTFTIDTLDLSKTSISLQSNSAILDTDIVNNQVQDSGKNKVQIKNGALDLKDSAFQNDVKIEYSYTQAVGNNPASVTVKVSAESESGSNVTNSKQGSFPVTTDISGATIALKQNETFTYNGNAQIPYYGIKVVKGGVVIPESGYTVKYSDNINAGGYGVATVTGVGLYSGTATSTNLFYINQRSIKSSGISITVSTGTSSVRPTVTVKDGTTLLTENKDYQVTISGNVATITGINNYKDADTRTFSVVNQTIKSATVYTGTTYYYSGTSQEPLITVTGSDGKTLTKNVDYSLTYTQNGKIVSPKDAGTYGITITGIGKYAGTISNQSFTIAPFKKDWIEVTASAGYTTNNPYVTVKSIDGKITFVRDKDYKVTSAQTNAWNNTVTVYLTTMGNIEAGSTTAVYALVAKSIASCNAYFTNNRSSAQYTGSSISVPITVKDGYYTTLRQGTDYTVTYKNAAGKVVTAIRDAGTYTIEINGKGMYTGTTYLTFTVTGTDISNYTVTLRESSVNADGFAKIPVITSVAYSYYSKLSVNDYTVSYQDSTGKTVTRMSAPGTYKVVVTGKNGYSGSCYATFRIVGLAQSVTGVKDAYKVYPTTDTFKLNPQVTEGRITYTSSDASVASVDAYGYVTPHKAGRAVITISTTGNVKYDPASKNVVIKVYPNKAKMSQKPWNTGKKGQIKVRWNKQDNVTRYQVIYSRDKSFKKGTYKVKGVNAAVNSYTTQSTTVKGLYSGYTYYVKVRAIKYVYNDYGQKQIYYGNWSNWRSVKVK